MIVADSDVLIDALRGRPDAMKRLDATLAAGVLATTSVTAFEPLRAEDALQLAAARVWAGSDGGAELVTFDERLGLVARLEGFRVLPEP